MRDGKRVGLPTAIAVVLFVVVFIVAASRNEQPQRPRLPGARTEIDAADYLSLQDAVDALPDEGGVVRLPPGRFVIDQPLVIRQADTTLVGCGTAPRPA